MPVYVQVAFTLFFIFLVGCVFYFPHQYAVMKHDRRWRYAYDGDEFFTKVTLTVLFGVIGSVLWILVLALLPFALLGYGVLKWTERRLDKKDQMV